MGKHSLLELWNKKQGWSTIPNPLQGGHAFKFTTSNTGVIVIQLIFDPDDSLKSILIHFECNSLITREEVAITYGRVHNELIRLVRLNSLHGLLLSGNGKTSGWVNTVNDATSFIHHLLD